MKVRSRRTQPLVHVRNFMGIFSIEIVSFVMICQFFINDPPATIIAVLEFFNLTIYNS